MRRNNKEVPKVIENKFGTDVVDWSGKNVIYHCPFCQEHGKTYDESGKLWVHTEKFIFQCFRCGTTGKIDLKLGDYDLSEPLIEDSQLISTLTDIVRSGHDEIDLSPRFEYEISNQITVPGDDYYNYLTSRGITEYLIRYYDIRVGSIFSKYRRRVIVPNQIEYRDGICYTDMFVARTIENEGKRYLNPYGENKSRAVFNLHRIPKGSPIIICEGVFTAMSAGLNAVATYGKTVSDIQLTKILNNEPESIYVNLDSDARAEAIKLCRRIRRRGYDGKLYITSMPEGKDASDLGHARFMQLLSQSEEFDENMMKIKNILMSLD